jgi:hypothetical protein
MLTRSAIALAATALCAAAAAGCGGGSDASNSAAGAGPRIGVALRLADCDDWNQADTAEQLGTVKQLRDFAAGPVGAPGHGATLSDERGYEVLENWCEQDFAGGFKLYKLYTRAAAFSSLVPDEQ